MATLLDILNDLLQNRGPKTKELKGGLFLQYKQPETPFGELALVCYRIEKEPSANELKVVADHLRRLLPQGTELRTDKKPTSFKASDNRQRIYFAIRWSAALPTQATLIDAPRQLDYTEAK